MVCRLIAGQILPLPKRFRVGHRGAPRRDGGFGARVCVC
jgi:hypothetical protein